MQSLLASVVTAALLGAVAASGYAAFQVGKWMVLDILAHGASMPGWLEAVAPLKGRWLRLFIAAPLIAMLLVIVFTGVFYAVVIVLCAVALLLMFLASAVTGALNGG